MDKHTKYKKLLTKINTLDDDIVNQLRESLLDDADFARYIKKNYSLSYEEHDGLVKLLDLPKNENGYIKDKFGRPASYNGIRTLKREGTELPLTLTHKIEIRKSRKSYKYFRKYYVKILTKNGVGRPEPRAYQLELEDNLITGHDLVILYNRQSGKTVTVGTYLLWRAMFFEIPINIGVVANKGATAREVLDKIKKMFVELPLWLQETIAIWNKGEIEFGNRSRIMTDPPSSDSFRGYTCNIIYVDESAYIPASDYEAFADSVLPTMASLSFKQFIGTSTPNGYNHFYHQVQSAKNTLMEIQEKTLNASELIEIDGYEEITIDELYEIIQKRMYKNPAMEI
jgi:hypothetical protein